MDTSIMIQLFILFLLLLLSGFFSSAETALTTVNRMRLRALTEEGNRQAVRLTKIIDNYGKMLSTILIGNNIVNISASSLATTLAIHLWGSIAVGFVTGILTILVLIFGEIVPKTWASRNADSLALSYSFVIFSLMLLLTPVIKIVDGISNFVFLLLPLNMSDNDGAITENDLKTLVDVSHEGGIIESEEREMIYNVFDFGDSCAKDIMIPRIDMTCIDVNASYEELFQVFRESMYTRIPVYENNASNMIGVINIKDLFLLEDHTRFQIRDHIREAHYTYEFKKTADLLLEMRTTSLSMAFVLDEYGSTVGLITLEDLLEEIVGEIRDEYDADEQESLEKLSDFEYRIAGSMKLCDINDVLDTNLQSEDYDSIGGIVIELLDRLPKGGEEVVTPEQIRIAVESVKKNRVEWVHVFLPDEIIKKEKQEEVSE